MRVCFVSRRYFPAISGMSVYAANFLRQLAGSGHGVFMVSQYREDAAGIGIYGGGPPPVIPGVGVVGLRSCGEERINRGLPADFEADMATMVGAIQAADAIRPFDVIHAQYAYPTGLAAMEAARRLRIPCVVSIQGGDGHWVGQCCSTHKQAILGVLGHADALLIGSRSFAGEVHGHHGTPLERFTIVPGATDANRFAPRTNLRLGDVRDPPRLLYHGRVDRRKGTFELIDAVHMLLQAGRRLQLVVSGIGPDLDATLERAETAGIMPHCRFTGYADYCNAPTMYSQGDIFISPTYSEGFSNTILEAMASGLPVIATDTIGVVDCLEHERNGLLVPVRDTGALASTIARMLDDGPLRARLAKSALDDVRRLYTWPVVAGQIISVYERLAGTTPDTRWCEIYEPSTSLAEADVGCRFRRAPHLL